MSDRDELERARSKYRAVMRARLSLKHALERIDYRYDVIKPGVTALDSAAAQGELPAFSDPTEDEL